MKALFVAITLLTALTASAQTAPSIAPPPPSGQATGNAPPVSSGFRADDNNEFRRGRRGTMVVVEREDVEQRLADLEKLLGEAFERGGGRGRGKLREAYEQLNDIRDLLADAPSVRDYNPRPAPSPYPTPPPPPAYQPIADGQLRSILGTMSREPFAEDKINILQSAVGNNYFLVSQVQQVLGQFQFSKDKLEVVRGLWARVLDRQNGFQLYNAFSFSTDKEELKRIMSN
ncbi:DUF4476 domain-containing protein [Archangium sp.]|uniref:DUF4476 domain-containing protein n=1 Tax=Archangium sp. TaxID=1872627 RepID=UPI00389B1D1F